jgi:hypothetical protein
MKQNIEEILDQLITKMQDGQTVDDLLRSYPEYAVELKSLLILAQQIGEMPKPKPDPSAVNTIVSKVKKSLAGAQTRERFSLWRSIIQHPVAVRTVAIVVMLLVVVITTVSLSARSLPGDLLYSVKKLTEDVQFLLTVDTEGRARLHIRFADERTYELSCLLEKKARIDEEHFAAMLQEIRAAIDCTEFLDDETTAEIADHLAKCNHHQMAMLEETKQSECDFDLQALEEAIKTCIEHHNCIENMKEGNGQQGKDYAVSDGLYNFVTQ